MTHTIAWDSIRCRIGRVAGSRAGAVLAFCAVSFVAHAASLDKDFPNRPIRLLCPFEAGGGNDLFSRSIGTAIAKSIGQQVIVDNRPGANSIIAMQLLAKAEPDGYTLIMASSTLSINATLHRKLPYDSVKSFAHVSLAVSTPLVVGASPTSSIKTIPDLISAAKAKPGEIMFPSAGTGNSTHLAGELLASMAGIKLGHVPYKGSLPGINEVIAGRLQVVFPTLPSAKPHLISGRLRAVAVTSANRASDMPDVPTVAESGLSGYEVSTWYGVLAPAGTPRAVLTKLHAEIVKALETPEVRKTSAMLGLEKVGNTPEQFSAYVRGEISKWAKVIKAANVAVE